MDLDVRAWLNRLRELAEGRPFSTCPKEYQEKFPYNPAGSVLPVSELAITERCYGNCPFCGNESDHRGQHMRWDLFRSIVDSPQIGFYRTDMAHLTQEKWIGLVDGEVLIYLDKEASKTLIDILEVMVVQKGLRVSFATAGLIPQNRTLGRPVFDYLKSLSPRLRDHVNISLTFTLANTTIPRDVYLDCMRETIGHLDYSIRKIVCLVYDPDSAETGLERTKAEFFAIPGSKYLDFEPQAITNMGRAFDNYAPTRKKSSSRCNGFYLHFGPCFGIRPSAEVYSSCKGFGFRGSSLGNVYDNDAGQILAAFHDHERAFRKHLGKRPDGMRHCDWHRMWQEHVKLPRSEKPIVAQPVRLQRCG